MMLGDSFSSLGFLVLKAAIRLCKEHCGRGDPNSAVEKRRLLSTASATTSAAASLAMSRDGRDGSDSTVTTAGHSDGTQSSHVYQANARGSTINPVASGSDTASLVPFDVEGRLGVASDDETAGHAGLAEGAEHPAFCKPPPSDAASDTTSELDLDDDPPDAPSHEQVPRWWWISGLVVSSALCIGVTSPLFDIAVYEVVVSLAFALLVALLAVRALGETDLNPVSGVGKLSQVVFAVIAPGNLVSNLMAGAVAEAGAQQAGDMMQDLKTGHLLRASPREQFIAQLIGSAVSVPCAVAAYALFTAAYDVPGPELKVPTAEVCGYCVECWSTWGVSDIRVAWTLQKLFDS